MAQVTNVITIDIDAYRQELTARRISEASAWELATNIKEVLEMVEWVNGYCPWCGGQEVKGHFKDCARQLVLYPPEPIEPVG